VVAEMMLALAPPAGLRTVALRETIERHVVLVRRRGDDARPTVRAMTAVIEETVRAAAGPPPAP
jgi:hypothetical protein